MQAGLLKKTIKVYNRVLTKNKYGEDKETFVLSLTTRCREVYRSGYRAIENQEIDFNYSKTFEVRFYVSITETDRLYFEDKWYRILSIQNVREQNKKIVQAELINE